MNMKFIKLLLIFGSCISLLFSITTTAIAQENYDLAIENYLQAIKINTSNCTALVERSFSYLKQGNIKLADKYYKKYTDELFKQYSFSDEEKKQIIAGYEKAREIITKKADKSSDEANYVKGKPFSPPNKNTSTNPPETKIKKSEDKKNEKQKECGLVTKTIQMPLLHSKRKVYGNYVYEYEPINVLEYKGVCEPKTKVIRSEDIPTELEVSIKPIEVEVAGEIILPNAETSSTRIVDSNILANAATTITQENKGLEYFKKQVEETPGDANAYFNLGRAYLFTENYDQTIQTLKKALKLNPDLKEAYSLLAAAYFDTNEYDLGKEMLIKSGVVNKFVNNIESKIKSKNEPSDEEVELIKQIKKDPVDFFINQTVKQQEKVTDGLKASSERALKANCSVAASNVLTYLAVEDLTPSEAAKKALEELQKENRKSVFDNKVPAYGTEALPGVVTILPTDNNTVEITGYGVTNEVLVKKEIEAP
ncbi:MAG: tetratricopeptide repeat protein [Cyanobacteriota bacterium]